MRMCRLIKLERPCYDIKSTNDPLPRASPTSPHYHHATTAGPKLVRFEDEESGLAEVPERHFVELWDIGGSARYRAARKSLFAEVGAGCRRYAPFAGGMSGA